MKQASTNKRGGRPLIMTTRGVISSGHYLATECGMQLLRNGGNAMDAAAATAFALALLKPHQNGIGGEAPTLWYDAATKNVCAISGHGTAPREATIERFKELGLDIIPGDGFLPAMVPSVTGTWIRALERFGTKGLADVLAPVIEIARRGFPMYDPLRSAIERHADRFRAEWPASAALYLPAGQAPGLGAIFRNTQWADTFQMLVDAEARASGREKGLCAAYDVFYNGPVAKAIVHFARSTEIPDASGQAHSALLTKRDFEDFQVRFEDPVSTEYRGVAVYKCSSWTQGPVLLQMLNLLEQTDPRAMGHNTPDYIHTVVECMKLAFADREFYYGDPAFTEVPFDRLLSKTYAAERFALVDPRGASLTLRPGGPASVPPEGLQAHDVLAVDSALAAGGDTTKLDVIDDQGNMVSTTQSGGWLMSSPVIPGLGFCLGTRGQMFSLEPHHPNCLAPGKRPRTTLTPSLATRGGRPYLSFGSPGGDSQDQWALQFLLNVLEFDMSLQEAVEAPTFWTRHFPDSFYPRRAEIGSLYMESRIPESISSLLSDRGHRITRAGPWAGGNTLAVSIDPETGLRCAAASPRLDPSYAAGW